MYLLVYETKSEKTKSQHFYINANIELKIKIVFNLMYFIIYL